MKRRAKWLLGLAAVALGAAAGSCDQPEHPCDPGQIYTQFLCVNAPPDAAPPPSGTDAGSQSDAQACAKHEGFGERCEADSDCRCGTICNPLAKYCTKIKCLADPTMCPPEPAYTCRDISMFDPAVGSTCFKN